MFTLFPQFAASHEISLFYEVSAKSGSNVNEAFEAFFKQIHVHVSHLNSLLFSSTLRLDIVTFAGNWSSCQ